MLESRSMKFKFPISIKLLSVLLSIAIFAVSLPLSVFSIESDSEPDASLSLAGDFAQETEEKEEYELIQYRDAFSKQYKQPDGTVRVVQHTDRNHLDYRSALSPGTDLRTR